MLSTWQYLKQSWQWALLSKLPKNQQFLLQIQFIYYWIHLTLIHMHTQLKILKFKFKISHDKQTYYGNISILISIAKVLLSKKKKIVDRNERVFFLILISTILGFVLFHFKKIMKVFFYSFSFFFLRSLTHSVYVHGCVYFFLFIHHRENEAIKFFWDFCVPSQYISVSNEGKKKKYNKKKEMSCDIIL